jgi:hypothetical protein
MRNRAMSHVWFVALQAAAVCAGLALWAGMAQAQVGSFPSETATTNWGGLVASAAVLLAIYAYFAFCLQLIANKTGTANGWLAWIPLANVFLWLKVAGRPAWWLLLLLIPLVNVVVSAIAWVDVARARQKAGWWGIMFIVPVMNFVAPGYLAFSD